MLQQGIIEHSTSPYIILVQFGFYQRKPITRDNENSELLLIIEYLRKTQ